MKRQEKGDEAEAGEDHHQGLMMLLLDPARMPYFLDYLVDRGGEKLLMFWLEAEQLAEFTGDAKDAYHRAHAFVDKYVGLEPKPGEGEEDSAGGDGKRTTPHLPSAVRQRLRQAVTAPGREKRSIGSVWAVSDEIERGNPDDIVNDVLAM